jgi:mevalonate pyrophosphate decarboxylase
MCDCQHDDGGVSLMQLADQVHAMHTGLQTVVDEQHRKFSRIVYERARNTSATSITIQSQSRNRVLLQNGYVYSSAGAATLTLGDMVLQVPQGLTPIKDLALLLDPSDTRTLTSGSSGELSAYFFGEDLMNFGMVK